MVQPSLPGSLTQSKQPGPSASPTGPRSPPTAMIVAIATTVAAVAVAVTAAMASDVRAGVAVGIRAFAFPVSDATLGTQDSACGSGGAACSRAEKPTLSYGKPNEDKRRLNRRSVKSCDRLNDENSPVVAKRLSKPRSNRSTDARSGEENAIKGWALELVGMAATASTQSDRRRTYSHRLSVDDSPCFASSATLYLVTL